jgi:hypothetical protein
MGGSQFPLSGNGDTVWSMDITEQLPSLPLFGWVLVVAWLVLAMVSFSLVLGGLSGLWRRHVIGGCTRLCCGLVLAGGVAAAGAIGLGLQAYSRLTYEQQAVRISFVQQAPDAYTAVLRFPDRTEHQFLLQGQEWQVDARVLRWKGPAVVAGMDTLFRLERVSGRHRNLAREREGPRSVYDLRHQGDWGSEWLDPWHLAKRYPDRAQWVDAVYGSATYLPMADGAQYEVVVTASGLAARPLNAAAWDAIRRW